MHATAITTDLFCIYFVNQNNGLILNDNRYLMVEAEWLPREKKPEGRQFEYMLQKLGIEHHHVVWHCFSWLKVQLKINANYSNMKTKYNQ